MLALVIVGLVIVINVYNRWTLGVCHSKRNMRGKTVVVTGANSGIGKETVRDLAMRGARVIMACRNMDFARAVRNELTAATNNDEIVAMPLDVSSFTSIRRFVSSFLASEERLDVLIHNAGIFRVVETSYSDEGLEMQMATHYYGPFLLTRLLLDVLKRSAPSRIVVTSTVIYSWSPYTVESSLHRLPVINYIRSKHAGVIFAKELSRRLAGSGVTVNVHHPGVIHTGICRPIFPFDWVIWALGRTMLKSLSEGAQTTIYLAVSEEVDGVSGKYFEDCQAGELSGSARDPENGQRLWEVTEDVVGIKTKC